MAYNKGHILPVELFFVYIHVSVLPSPFVMAYTEFCFGIKADTFLPFDINSILLMRICFPFLVF
jgi:hypothetical protein